MKAWAKNMARVKTGFTIIELLIVIVVIGILAGILFIGYGLVQNDAHDASVKSDLNKFAEVVNLKVLDDDAIPAGGATSALAGDPTVLTGIEADPDEDSYDGGVANLYYCAGEINGTDEFGLVARSISRKVFYYLSASGIAEYTGGLSWTATPGIAACTAIGFVAPFTWSYGYDPNVGLLWADWAQ